MRCTRVAAKAASTAPTPATVLPTTARPPQTATLHRLALPPTAFAPSARPRKRSRATSNSLGTTSPRLSPAERTSSTPTSTPPSRSPAFTGAFLHFYHFFFQPCAFVSDLSIFFFIFPQSTDYFLTLSTHTFLPSSQPSVTPPWPMTRRLARTSLERAATASWAATTTAARTVPATDTSAA